MGTSTEKFRTRDVSNSQIRLHVCKKKHYIYFYVRSIRTSKKCKEKKLQYHSGLYFINETTFLLQAFSLPPEDKTHTCSP